MKDNKNYIKVYFRLDNDYNGSSGWSGLEEKETFDKECKDLFAELGFEVVESKYSSGCTRVYKEFNSLYLHPQSFSGILEVNDDLGEVNTLDQCDFIREIQDLMNSKKYKQIRLNGIDFGIRNTFTKDEVIKNYEENELLEVLSKRKNDLKDEILLKYTTSRSNLYKNEGYCDKYNSLKGINFKKHDYRKEHNKDLDGIVNNFIKEVVNELIDSGKLNMITKGSRILLQNNYDVKEYRKRLKEMPRKSLYESLFN